NMGKVLGFHIICCTYGFWLPNDERGSCSDFVRLDALTKFGPANPVSHSRSVARKPYDFQIRQLARHALSYPPVLLTLDQIGAVGRYVNDNLKRARLPPQNYPFVVAYQSKQPAMLRTRR